MQVRYNEFTLCSSNITKECLRNNFLGHRNGPCCFLMFHIILCVCTNHSSFFETSSKRPPGLDFQTDDRCRNVMAYIDGRFLYPSSSSLNQIIRFIVFCS